MIDFNMIYVETPVLKHRVSFVKNDLKMSIAPQNWGQLKNYGI